MGGLECGGLDCRHWCELGGAEAEAGAGAEPEVEADATVCWWVVVDSSTVEGVGRAVGLEVVLQAFVATVGVGGALGGGQMAMQLGSGDLGGQKGWRLGLIYI